MISDVTSDLGYALVLGGFQKVEVKALNEFKVPGSIAEERS